MANSFKTGAPFVPYGLFTYATIPNVLMQYRGVSAGAKLVWARLCQHAGRSGRAYPKQETLAAELGTDVRTIQRLLTELVMAEFLQVVRPDGQDRLLHRANHYLFLWHPIFNAKSPVPEGVAESAKADPTESVVPDPTEFVSPDPTESVGLTIKTHNTKKHTIPTAAADGVSLREDDPKKHPRWKAYARQLAEAIGTRHKLNKTSSLAEWAKAFYQIHHTDGVPIPRLKEVLTWYCQAYKEDRPYTPIADSGFSLRKKWVRIDAAMQRDAHDQAGTDADTKSAKQARAVKMYLIPTPDYPGFNFYVRQWFDRHSEFVYEESGLYQQNGEPALEKDVKRALAQVERERQASEAVYEAETATLFGENKSGKNCP